MWKYIKSYEGIYRIYDNGDVMNEKTGLIKKPWMSNKGYYCIDLAKDGVTKHYLLHRLLAEAFIPNPNNYPIVLHKDNNKLNVSLDNLSWGTYSENQKQAIRDGLNVVPIPDNRKYYNITNYTNISIILKGQNKILNEIGYGNEHTVRNLLHRNQMINKGPYKGCFIVQQDPVDICKIVNAK